MAVVEEMGNAESRLEIKADGVVAVEVDGQCGVMP